MIKIIVAKLVRIDTISAVKAVGSNVDGSGSTGITIVSPGLARFTRPLTIVLISPLAFLI